VEEEEGEYDYSMDDYDNLHGSLAIG